MKSQKNKSVPFYLGGFTLIEVLIALLILAIVMVTVLKVVGDQVFNVKHVKEVSVARWVGMNTIARMQAGMINPEDAEGEEKAFGKTWYWYAQTRDSDAKQILQIEVEISLERGKSSIAHVLGFIKK